MIFLGLGFLDWLDMVLIMKLLTMMLIMEVLLTMMLIMELLLTMMPCLA